MKNVIRKFIHMLLLDNFFSPVRFVFDLLLAFGNLTFLNSKSGFLWCRTERLASRIAAPGPLDDTTTRLGIIYFA